MEHSERVRFYDDSCNNLINEKNPELIKVMHRMLGKCVQHHTAIIKYFFLKYCWDSKNTFYLTCSLIDELEGTYSFVILAQFGSSCMMLCLLLFQCSQHPFGSPRFVASIIYYFTMLYQLVIYCWYGNEVTLQVCIYCFLFYLKKNLLKNSFNERVRWSVMLFTSVIGLELILNLKLLCFI